MTANDANKQTAELAATCAEAELEGAWETAQAARAEFKAILAQIPDREDRMYLRETWGEVYHESKGVGL